MARNAPAVTGGANRVNLSFSFIDDSGDQRSISIKADSAVTDAQIEALAAAYGAATNAVLWKVEKSLIWRATPDASLAVDAEQNSVFDNVVLNFQQADGTSFSTYLPAPIEGIMNGDSDEVNTAAATYTAWRDAMEAVLDDAFEPVQVRYTERREINTKKQPA